MIKPWEERQKEKRYVYPEIHMNQEIDELRAEVERLNTIDYESEYVDLSERLGHKCQLLQAEVDKLKLALSGKTFAYDPDSYKRGLLDAAEIASEYSSLYDIAENFRDLIVEQIKAKAEKL